jgi:hypothetical protein
MKSKFIIACLWLALFACSKSNTDSGSDNVLPNNAPICVKNLSEKNPKIATIKKWTNDTTIIWSVLIDPKPNAIDDEVKYIFNEACDTLCIQCFCSPVNCKKRIDFTQWQEIE